MGTEADKQTQANAARAMSARINHFVDRQNHEPDIDVARQLMIEAFDLLPAEEAWAQAAAVRTSLGDDDPVVPRIIEITAEKGSPDAAFAMYELAGDMTAQLRWLVRADALGHAEARVIAEGLRNEGLLAPRV